MITVFYILSILFTLLGMISKKNLKKACYIISVFLLVLVMSAQNKAEDELNTYLFYHIKEYRLGISYFCQKMMDLGNYLCLDFGMFNFITTAIVLITIFYIFSKTLNDIGICILMYTLSCSLLDAVFYKQFLSISVVVIAFHVLLYNKRPLIKYLVLICVATMIHSSCLALLLFVLILYRKIKMKTIMIFVAIGGGVLTFLNGDVVPIISTLLEIIDPEKNEMYEVGGGMGWLIQLLWCLLAIYIIKVLKKNCYSNGKPTFESKAIIRIEEILEISLLFIPLCMTSMVYSRLYRYLYILVIYGFGLTLNVTKKKGTLFLLAFIFILYVIIMNLLLWSPDTTILPLLDGQPFWYKDSYFYSI